MYMEKVVFIFVNSLKIFFRRRSLLSLVLMLFTGLLHAQANFDLVANVGCTPFHVGLTVKDFVPDSTLWEFGDGTKAKGNTTFKIYGSEGVFEIKMIAYKNGVPNTVTKSVTVHKTPTANFEFDKVIGCPPLEVNFKDKSTVGSSSIVKRTWGFGNGRVVEGNLTALTQTFNASGARDLSLIVVDQNGCTDRKTYPAGITIHPRPVVDFEFRNSNSCEIPVECVFTNKSDTLTKYTYLWEFGDGEVSTETTPVHKFKNEGTFEIKLTATDANGCTNSKTLSNMIVNEKFSVDIKFTDTLGCDSLFVGFQPDISSLYKKLTWTFSPKLNADLTKMTLSAKEVGVHEVKLEATSQFGCVVSKIRNVYVNQTPVVDFEATPTLGCKVPLNVQFTNLSQHANTYLWNFGDGFSSTDPNPLKSYNKENVYTVRLIGSSQNGCSNSIVKLGYISIVDPIVEMNISNQEGCAPLLSDFSVKCTNGFTINNVQWTFGNGNVYNGIQPPAQTYSGVNSYTVTARVSFAEGCNDVIVTNIIRVGNTQNFNASVSGLDLCPSTTLTGQIGAIANATYEWKIGNITTLSGRTLSYKFAQSGIFPVTAIVTSNGCKSSKDMGSVVVKPTAADFVILNNCSGGLVTLINNSFSGVQSTWDFGDGTILASNSKNVSHEYKKNGTYTIKLTVNNSTTGCSDVITKPIEIKPKSTSGFSLPPTKGCLPLSVEYQNVPGATSGTWIIDTVRSSGNIFKRTITDPGVYTLTLVSVNEGCRDTLVFKDLIQAVKPDAGFKFDPIGGCSPVTVNFEDTSSSSLSTITKLNWQIGNIATETANKFSRTFSINAIIPITLTVQDNVGCKDTITHDVIVAMPHVDFELPTSSFCTGTAFKPVNLSTGVGLQYFWDFGDGSPIVTDSAPEHFYTKEGVYDFELKIIDANNCEDVKKITNAITIQDIDYDFSAFPTSKHCPELITDFTIIPSDIIYRRTIWDLGNGTIIDDTTRNPKYIYMAAGVYDVTLTLEDYRGCKEVIKKEKLIDIGGPSGEFNVTMPSSCAPVEALIVADIKNSVANFWDFGDGEGKYDTDAYSETTHVYEHAGVYKPSVTVNDGMGCIVTVYGPEIKVGGAIPKSQKSADLICTGELVDFADVSLFEEHAPVISRFWTFSDGYTSSDSSFSRTVTTADSIDIFVKLEIEDAVGCRDFVEDTLRVFATAPLAVEDNLVICKGDSVELKASKVHYYEWGQSGSLSATDIPNPVAFPLQTTVYNVRGYVSPTCFTDKTVTVEVKEAFTGAAGTDTILCIGDQAKLWVQHEAINSGRFKYQWTLDGEVVDTLSEIIVSPERTSAYLVNVKNGACKDFNQAVTIEVREYPELNVSESVSILSGQEIKLEAYSEPGVSYAWTPLPATGCTNCPFAFVRPVTTTKYTVTVTNQAGCTVSEDITVDVATDCDGSMIEIQNVFTPNNDGVNDFFTLKNNDLIKLGRIRIYARTGEIVYESANAMDAWDGTFNGVQLNSGVYVYYLEAQCNNGQPLLLKGNVTLLR